MHLTTAMQLLLGSVQRGKTSYRMDCQSVHVAGPHLQVCRRMHLRHLRRWCGRSSRVSTACIWMLVSNSRCRCWWRSVGGHRSHGVGAANGGLCVHLERATLTGCVRRLQPLTTPNHWDHNPGQITWKSPSDNCRAASCG